MTNGARTALRVLRWLLVAPAAAAGFQAALVAMRVVDSALLGFCPPERLVSGVCFWPRWAGVALLAFGGALAVVLVVAFAAAVAPARKTAVAWAALTVGGVFALRLADPMTGPLDAATLAVVAATYGGGLGGVLVVRRLTRGDRG